MKTKPSNLDGQTRIASGANRGFTLVELITILLFLTLLSSVMIPALARTGRGSKWTICRNNLRQMGTAVLLYANENRDHLAFPNWDGGSTFNGRVIPGWLYTVTNGGIPDPGPGGSYADDPQTAYATGLWFQYIRSPKTYLCPLGSDSETYSQPHLRNNRLSTYAMNGAACGYGLNSTQANCRTTDVWNPGAYLLWEPDENASGPGIPGPFVFNDGGVVPSGPEGIGKLHSLAGAEVLRVNGAVPFVPFRVFGTESTSSGRSLAWWSPFSSSGH